MICSTVTCRGRKTCKFRSLQKRLVSWRHEARAIGMLCALAKARLSSRRYIVPSSCICKKCISNARVQDAALKRGPHQLCKEPHWRQAGEAAEVEGRLGVSCRAHQGSRAHVPRPTSKEAACISFVSL